MRKQISVLLLTVAAVLSLTACGGKFTCDGCGEEKSGKSYKATIMGEELTLCKDCKKEWDAAKKELQNMFK